MKITAVVNTYNEEKNIIRCLESVRPYVDEIVLVDMHSDDKTVRLAKKYTDKVFFHDYVGYVEPARNFALSKANTEWILLIDADEELPEHLGHKLKELITDSNFDFYRIPRKNVIFGHWMKHSGWWPDYQIRFFKKTSVTWSEEIHGIPVTRGKGKDLSADENNALFHHHYVSIDQYLLRLVRYTTFQAKQLSSDGTIFHWSMLIRKPIGEYLTRYFAWEGYKDGLHGLALSLLQSFAILIVYVKLWELEKFPKTVVSLDMAEKEMKQASHSLRSWFLNEKVKHVRGLKKYIIQLRNIFPI